MNYDIDVRLTSTLRCGYHRYVFKEGTGRKILFDLANANNKVNDWKIEQEGNAVVKGYQAVHEEKIYFYAVVDTPIEKLEKDSEGN